LRWTVRPPDPDDDQVKVGQNLFPNDNIERQFVQSETSTDIFKVLPDGQVVLKKDLDREALCGKSDTCTFSSIVSSTHYCALACTFLAFSLHLVALKQMNHTLGINFP